MALDENFKEEVKTLLKALKRHICDSSRYFDEIHILIDTDEALIDINHNINRKMVKQVFSADFKRKVIETRWKNKLSFKEVAEHFNLDNPSLIAAW